MKYIFFGSPRFAEIILGQLMDAGMPPAALVCNPDRPFGRKQAITPPPTKVLLTTRAKDIPVLQPEKPAAAANILRTLGADIFVVAAYALIIPEVVLEIPRLGTIGVHPSLLPKYRGASPIQSAILGGEPDTGTTIYMMDEAMDHGPIVSAVAVPLAIDEQYASLEEKLALASARLLIRAMPDFIAGKITVQPQDETRASYTTKFKTEDAFVDNADLVAAENGDREKAVGVMRKINAFNPEPGAWTMRGGKRTKLLAAKIQADKLILLAIQQEGERAKELNRVS